MSTKKDKFNHKDHFYMNLALNLARERSGLTGENPSVGCVIVKNDCVMSVGCTNINGRPHAEQNAINFSKKNIKNSTLYVTLEPWFQRKPWFNIENNVNAGRTNWFNTCQHTISS